MFYLQLKVIILMKKILVLLAAVFVLSGCQSLPPLNFAIQDVEPSKNKIDGELKSVSVSLASPEEKKRRYRGRDGSSTYALEKCA